MPPHPRRCRAELEAEVFGPGLQTFDATLSESPLVCLRTLVDVGLTPAEQAVDYRGQFPGCGKHGHISADPSRMLAIVCPERGLAMAQRCGRHPQGCGHPRARAVALLLFHRLSGTGRSVPRQRDMLDELLLGGKTTQVRPVFTEYHLHQIGRAHV